jgi:hypothetical protein
MKLKNMFTTVAVMLVLTGCATTGLQSPQSFDQRLAYAYGTHTAVMEAAALSKENGSLSKDEAAEVAKLADQAQVFLDGAKAVEKTNPSGAQKNLELALAVLQQLQLYLGGKTQ